MTTYKCINCGEIRENQIVSTCPTCGYTMFESPYDRKSILISEIQKFIDFFEVTSINRNDLVFDGKEIDDHRFPNYERILKYVSSRDRTNDFFNNLYETINQIKQHFTTSFSNSYPISFDIVVEKIAQYDKMLLNVADVVISDTIVELDAPDCGHPTLLYTESQNKYLWFSASELLGLLEKLTEKIRNFIKLNNLFGNSHKYYPKMLMGNFEAQTDFKEEFEEAILKTEKILKKKYIVDIMDDGSDELREMLTCLWNDIELIMCAPLFTKSYNYQTALGSMTETEFFTHISDILRVRYMPYNELINSELSSDNQNEERLFHIYKELINIDNFGILVPVGVNLIDVGESEKKLNALIGLSEIKESIKKIKAYMLANQKSNDLNIHMCFMGNPGTGKTEVARLIAGILYENKILPSQKVIEVDRNGLVSQYFGATAEKTSRVIASAIGGVLFIDEAYALGNSAEMGSTDYGREAIDTLVKAMEDHRGEFCVILAGYRNEMLNMLTVNPGFKSRVQFILDFPNYSRKELGEIARLMLEHRKYTVGEAALNRILDITDIKRKDPHFANAREIRNILDQVIMCQNLRCGGTEENELGIVDVNKYIQDTKLRLPTSGDGEQKKILSGEEELEQLIGLEYVKRMVRKIKAYAKRNKDMEDFNLHMCFHGNPGTGKTEVARIISRIFHDVGVLTEAKLVETDAHGLIGRYVGETGIKTEAKVKEALGGVLFIDEAYALAGTQGDISSYGEEAITVLLKSMEDYRGQFCVILAGYKDEMLTLMNSNPGFESRIQFSLNFPDYTREEFGKLVNTFLSKKRYTIDPPAMELLLDIVEYFRYKPNFANARTVRNIMDQVLMNQNLRTEEFEHDNVVILSDVEEYLLDEGIDLRNSYSNKRTIGFI